MDTLRILLAAMPRLMSDLVELALSSEPDMEVVGVLVSTSSLASEVNVARPDLVVLGVVGTQLPEACGPMLTEHPELRVVGIDLELVEAGVYSLRLDRTELGAVTPNELAHEIRRVARTPSRLGESN